MFVKRRVTHRDAPISIPFRIGQYWYCYIGVSEFEKAQLENFDKPNIDSDSLTPKTFSQVL